MSFYVFQSAFGELSVELLVKSVMLSMISYRKVVMQLHIHLCTG